MKKYYMNSAHHISLLMWWDHSSNSNTANINTNIFPTSQNSKLNLNPKHARRRQPSNRFFFLVIYIDKFYVISGEKSIRESE